MLCGEIQILTSFQKRGRQLATFLLAPEGYSLAKYSLLAFPIAWVPSIGLLSVVGMFWYLAGYDFSSVTASTAKYGTADLLGTIFVAPLVETLLLAFGVAVLSLMFQRKLTVVLVSGLVWAGLHGLFGPMRFVGSLWAFVVFSCAFMAWRPRSWLAGMIAAGVPHVLCNLCTITLIAVLRAIE